MGADTSPEFDTETAKRSLDPVVREMLVDTGDLVRATLDGVSYPSFVDGVTVSLARLEVRIASLERRIDNLTDAGTADPD